MMKKLNTLNKMWCYCSGSIRADNHATISIEVNVATFSESLACIIRHWLKFFI